MDKAAALAKFNTLLNELVAKKAKPGLKPEQPEINLEIESEEPELEPELAEKGAMLKSAMGTESGEAGMEMPEASEDMEETEEDEESEESEEENKSSPADLPPELLAMLERAIGKVGPKRANREMELGHVGGRVPMAGISATEIKVVGPKGRKSR